MKQILKKLFNKYNINYTEEMLEQLEVFYNFTIAENKKFNLTGIIEKEEFAIKHILDSVLTASFIKPNAKVIDVGAGAGFPSIPLKILRPDLNMVMVDSLQKRVNFLNQAATLLSLKNIQAVHSRAEDYVIKNREIFDVCVARAVAELCTLAEYCLPFVCVGGLFIAYKSVKIEEEISSANYAITVLGGKINNVQSVFLEEINAYRNNVIINKIKTTPNKYPRGKNLAKANPLKN